MTKEVQCWVSGAGDSSESQIRLIRCVGAVTVSVTTAGRAEGLGATSPGEASSPCSRMGSQQEKHHCTRARGAGAWRPCSLPPHLLKQHNLIKKGYLYVYMKVGQGAEKILVSLNSKLAADGHSKRLHSLSHNFCRLANSANSETAQMLPAGCLLCYSISLFLELPSL